MIKNLTTITFIGSMLCLVMPAIVVEYHYLHGESKPMFSLAFGTVQNIGGSWYGHRYLSGYQTQALSFQLIALVNGLVWIGEKPAFQRMGSVLNHYRTYIFMLSAIAINLWIVDYGFPVHHITFYFGVGGYFLIALIVVNIVVRWNHKPKKKG